MGKKKKSVVGERAWNLLRLAVLWGRKGGVFKRRLMMELRLVPKFLKGLAHPSTRNDHQIISSHYMERQFSFNGTPIFHVKIHHHRLASSSMRFLLPCISAEEVDFDYDFSVNDHDNGRTSYSTGSETDVEDLGEAEECGYEGCDEKENGPYVYSYEIEDEGIDSKAEKFIAKFHEQMRLQRQISYLEHAERGSKS
ncbi:CTP synthase family protein isoform 1 [Hibiscus syriacus]|uniref:CTP synthase family protein isoform 1 n=1 Tax=Hibiscus syriacus TaxID=106335 RepID=A0A6A3AVD1_HIBSY|nr:uncharacterized protein LOC120120193 [Hibiscus syriacus]KAE8708700.1 CTP synthase family protein isoform 1 [Hibiscus syriacus]